MFDTGEVAVPSELRRLAGHVAPVVLARDQGLDVLDPLRPLLPDGRLTRGSVVGVAGGPGALTLALALAAGPSTHGSWTVVMGLPELGLAAAGELGVRLDRLALVALPPHDPAVWAPTLAAVVGSVDVVLVDGRLTLRAAETRRLAARARERGTVVVPVVPGTGAPEEASAPGRRRRGTALGDWATDVVLEVDAGPWEGAGAGDGHLSGRRVEVAAGGRGRAARVRRAALWLPGPDGTVSAAPLPAGHRDATRSDGASSRPGGGPAPGDGGSAVVAAGVARTERFLRSVPTGRQVS
jgi:hypothetical protein